MTDMETLGAMWDQIHQFETINFIPGSNPDNGVGGSSPIFCLQVATYTCEGNKRTNVELC